MPLVSSRASCTLLTSTWSWSLKLDGSSNYWDVQPTGVLLLSISTDKRRTWYANIAIEKVDGTENIVSRLYSRNIYITKLYSFSVDTSFTKTLSWVVNSFKEQAWCQWVLIHHEYEEMFRQNLSDNGQFSSLPQSSWICRTTIDCVDGNHTFLISLLTFESPQIIF